jgi:hypothetical protein
MISFSASFFFCTICFVSTGVKGSGLVQIIQRVRIMQVLTEKSKTTMIEKYILRKQQLQKECEQLRFELKKLEKLKKHPSHTLKLHFEKEIDQRIEKVKVIEFQLNQINVLPIGSELNEKELETLVEVNVGDKWEDKQTKTIVIQDGIVLEIR